MEQDERLRFSFGAAAAAYAEHRPDYARAAVRWALERAPGPRVLDLGAGTGKLTAVMAALGADVIAVEPDPAMLAELRRALPDVRALPGRAEAIPLPDASVDAVLVGDALHWFDMAVAGPEIARVLVPGGILACRHHRGPPGRYLRPAGGRREGENTRAVGAGHRLPDDRVHQPGTHADLHRRLTGGRPPEALAELGHLDADPGRVGLIDVDGLSFRGTLRLQTGDLGRSP